MAVDHQEASLPVLDEPALSSIILCDDEESPHPSEIPPSGVHPTPETLALRVEMALSASSRTAAALADIARTAKFLLATVKAVSETNAALTVELEELRTSFGGKVDRASLERRIQQLEKTLDESVHGGDHDWAALVADHDDFIAMLVTDHERELSALRREMSAHG